jgi:hypothetical protein
MDMSPVQSLEAMLVATVRAGLVHKLWSAIERGGETLFELHESPEVIFGLRLNADQTQHGVLLFPALGVSPKNTVGLYSAFLGLSHAPTASFGAGLADLLHAVGIRNAPYSRWFADSPENVDDVALVFCDDLEVYGMPFYRSLSTVDAIIERLEEPPKSIDTIGHLAIAYASKGEFSEAESALRSYWAAAESEPALIQAQCRKFIQSFIVHFGMNDASMTSHFDIG